MAKSCRKSLVARVRAVTRLKSHIVRCRSQGRRISFRHAAPVYERAVFMFIWNVLQELSAYTDRELHDIGIDRADIYQIARLASQEQH